MMQVLNTSYIHLSQYHLWLKTITYSLFCSALERAESTLFVSSGMGAIVAILLSLVRPGGHIVATKDCYWEARMFIQNKLLLMGVSVSVPYFVADHLFFLIFFFPSVKWFRSDQYCCILIHLAFVFSQATFVDMNDLNSLKEILQKNKVSSSFIILTSKYF